MNKTIYKYQFDITDEQQIQLPRGAIILHIADQRGFPQLWALIDPGAPPEPYTLQVRGTGHCCDDVEPSRYIGTFFQRGGDLVWHVFAK